MVGFSLFEDVFIVPRYILSLFTGQVGEFGWTFFHLARQQLVRLQRNRLMSMCCVFPRPALIGGSEHGPRLYFRPLTRDWPAGSLLMSLHAPEPLVRLPRAAGKRRCGARLESWVALCTELQLPGVPESLGGVSEIGAEK